MTHRHKLLLLLFIGTLALLVFWGSFLTMAGGSDIAQVEAKSNSAGDFCCYNYMPLILVYGKAVPVPIHQDDFSDPTSGWPIDDTGDFRWSYLDEEYELWMADPNVWIGAVNLNWGASGNYSLQAETRRHIGDTTDTGIVFDWANWQNTYVFLIDPTSQKYVVFKKDNDVVSVVIPVGTSSAINNGNGVNKLRVERDGAVIRVYANDQLLATGTDAPFAASLRFGFYGESDESSPAALRYDNLVVYSPIQSAVGGSTDTGWSRGSGPTPNVLP